MLLYIDKILDHLKKSLLIGFVLLFSISFAEKRQIGNTVIDVPEGWRFYVNRQGLGNLNKPYSKGEKPCDFCEFYIYKGSKKTGDFDTWVKEKQAVIRGKMKLASDKVITKEAPIAGGRMRIIISAFKKGRDLKIYCTYAMERKKTYEIVYFEGNANNPKQRKAALKMANQFAFKLLDQFEYISEGAKPVMSKPKPGSYQGVYYGYSWSTHMDISSGVPITMVDRQNKTMTFFKNGYYFEGVPENGILKFDPEFYGKNKPSDVGVYEVKGHKMQLMDSTGKKWEMDIDRDFLNFKRIKLKKTKIPKNGLRFTGYIKNESFSSMLGVHAAASNTVKFFSDGRYESSSFSGTVSANVAAGKENDSAGRYEIKDGIIIMKSNTGKINKRPAYFIRFSGKQVLQVGGSEVKDFKAK